MADQKPRAHRVLEERQQKQVSELVIDPPFQLRTDVKDQGDEPPVPEEPGDSPIASQPAERYTFRDIATGSRGAPTTRYYTEILDGGEAVARTIPCKTVSAAHANARIIADSLEPEPESESESEPESEFESESEPAPAPESEPESDPGDCGKVPTDAA